MIINITKENFDQEVLQNQGVVLLDFWASWCGPCKRFADVLHVLEKEMGQVTIGKVNIDEENDLANQFNIFSIPTIYIFKNGKVVENFVGGKSLGELKIILKNHL